MRAAGAAAVTEPGTDPTPDSGAWTMLGLAWLAYAYFGLLTGALPALLDTIVADFDLTGTEAGALLGVFPVLYVVSAFAVGRMGDRLGVNRTAAVGILVIAASSFLRAATPSFVPLLLATGILGVGGPVVSTVLPKLVAERFAGRHRTLAAGVYATGPAVGAGVALALTTSMVLPAAGSWRGAFVVYGLVGVVVFLAWSVFRRPSPGIRITAADTARRRVWTVPAVWSVVLVGVAAFTLGHGFASWIPSMLGAQGFTPGRAGLVASGNRVLQVAGALAAPYFATRLTVRGARKRLVLVALGVAVAGVLAVVPGHGALTVGGLGIQGLAAGAIPPLLVAILLDLPEVGEGTAATAAGLYFTVGQVSGSLAPVLVGWLRTATGGFEAGMYAVAGVVACTLIPAVRLRDTAPTGDRRVIVAAPPAEVA